MKAECISQLVDSSTSETFVHRVFVDGEFYERSQTIRSTKFSTEAFPNIQSEVKWYKVTKEGLTEERIKDKKKFNLLEERFLAAYPKFKQ